MLRVGQARQELGAVGPLLLSTTACFCGPRACFLQRRGVELEAPSQGHVPLTQGLDGVLPCPGHHALGTACGWGGLYSSPRKEWGMMACAAVELWSCGSGLIWEFGGLA